MEKGRRKKSRKTKCGTWLQVLLFCLIILVCLAGWAQAQERPSDTEEKPESILSDTSGAIREVVLQYSSTLAMEVLPTYKSFLRQIESDTTVHVVCENADQVSTFSVMLENWRIKELGRFKITCADREITVWARDRFIVKSRKDNLRKKTVVLPALPRSESSDRQNDLKVPAIIAKDCGADIETKESRLFFEGGNIVTSDKYVFTGYTTIRDPNIASDEEVIQLLEREFGKKVVVVGSASIPEPDDHVDMYLTPIDDKVLLLGDPLLARGILASGQDEQEEEDTDGEEKESSGEKEESTGEDGESPGDDEDTQSQEESTRVNEILKSFKHVKEQLEKKGFKIERIPIVHDEYGRTITYNNVLMEKRNGRKIVYMPVYGVYKLDYAASKKYKSLGFEVRPVDVSRIYRYGGTLRCVTNVLSRRVEEDGGKDFSDKYAPARLELDESEREKEFNWGQKCRPADEDD